MRKPWAIEFEGNRWTDETLTAAECIDIVRISGDGSWEGLHPLAGPLHCMAIVAALVANRLGEPLQMAIDRVQALTAADLLSCVKTYKPEVEAEPAASFS